MLYNNGEETRIPRHSAVVHKILKTDNFSRFKTAA